MSKLQQCYYVVVMKKRLFRGSSITECRSQREAKKMRKKHGGIILKGLREVE